MHRSIQTSAVVVGTIETKRYSYSIGTAQCFWRWYVWRIF